MIIEFYPAPKATLPPPDAEPFRPPTKGMEEYHATWYEHHAKKKNLSIGEFKRRDAIVREMYKEVSYGRHDLVYPFSLTEYTRHGQCRIKGVYRNYAEFESTEWPSNDRPFITTASPVMRPQEVFFSTGGYFQKTIPTD
jgi:hypothetical protein